MSNSLGRLYIDTVQGYLNPRMYIALNLGGGTNINEVVESSTQIFPNPVTDKLNIVSYGVNMTQIDIYSLDGKLIFRKQALGGGDLKLGGMLGVWLGVKGVGIAIMLSFILSNYVFNVRVN